MRITSRLALVALAVFALLGCEKDASDKGKSLYKSKKYEEAIAEFTHYLETHPKDADTYFNRGRSYEQLGKFEEALEDFQQATEIDPTKEEFWLSAGIANFKMKKFASTVSNMEGLLELQEKNGKAMVLKARAYAQMKGKIGLAMKTLDKAIAQNSKNGDAYLYRGLIRANANDVHACDDLSQAHRLKTPKAKQLLNKYCE